MSDNMVYFLMPDGTKVSNDPRFDQQKALEEALEARENTGNIGVPDAEMRAQTQVERLASLQSGQPGVGENAVQEDPVRDLYGPLGSPAQQIQKDDKLVADMAGASPNNTSVDDDEPVDSNAAVLEVREGVEKEREALLRAQAKLGEDGEGDPDVPYSEWSAAQLRVEVAKRNAEDDRESPLETQGLKKKSQLAQLLEDDDSAGQG